ncbi:Gfo/Idh/MocA family protein [Marinobacterium rhizophilum]|uniref:Gfo/Idh/MocA family protein n=1 Tax=Marinobacterium rhizophilum TaxID=420402 RepID=UPI00035FAB65|nr:Gfo/Idh/MocA family oxidoreductase [Marinobacterium rhizophilum]
MRDIGVGIIGTGFMGQSHALAYRAAAGIYPGSLNPVLVAIADINEDALERARAQYGFNRSTTDWTALVADPDVEIVSITTPNTLHREQALAAIAAGKHVHCEKPIAPNAADALVMMKAAEAAGVTTQVGYNYIKNPLLKLARQMIESGELGEITSFRGIHAEDYMADPQLPYSWRFDPAGGAGVIADLGSHIVGMARFLLGPITDLNADLETVIRQRPSAPGATTMRAVELDDIARLTVQFARGCKGSIEASWVATGRKMQLGFELVGSKGSLSFTQERFNELLYFKAGNDPRFSGYQRIEAGPQHDPYGHFCKAPGHQLGFNDLKTIEVAEFLQAIARGEAPSGPDFREAWEIQKVIDTAVLSSKERCWMSVP